MREKWWHDVRSLTFTVSPFSTFTNICNPCPFHVRCCSVCVQIQTKTETLIDANADTNTNRNLSNKAYIHTFTHAHMVTETHHRTHIRSWTSQFHNHNQNHNQVVHHSHTRLRARAHKHTQTLLPYTNKKYTPRLSSRAWLDHQLWVHAESKGATSRHVHVGAPGVSHCIDHL